MQFTKKRRLSGKVWKMMCHIWISGRSMTYLDAFKSGSLVLPSDPALITIQAFSSSDDYLVWRFLPKITALGGVSKSDC